MGKIQLLTIFLALCVLVVHVIPKYREGGDIELKIIQIPKVYNHYISLGVNLLNRDWLVKSYQSFPPINLTQRSKLEVKKINYQLSYLWYKATFYGIR